MFKRGERLKKFRIPIIILCLCILLSGCSFRLASVEDLISPISPSGENAEVLKAVDNYCRNGYSLKVPSSGKYTTSFIYYDLDGDKENEAISFYEPSDKKGTVNMAVIEKSNDGWKVIENIEGDGSDIISIDFCDLNNDSKKDIIVCWSIISKSTNYGLRVYRQYQDDKGCHLKAMSSSIIAGDFICADVNDDNFNELLVFRPGSSSYSARAELYSFKKNSAILICETKLDSSIISFASLSVGKTDQGTSVFADALKSDGESMVTELIYWSDYYDSIVSPFYDYDTGKTADTARSNLIKSRDIDNDKEIEIPTSLKVKNLPDSLTAENWKSYKNTVLNHKCYSYSCKRDKYIIVIDDKVFSKLTVNYDEDNRELIAVNTKNKKECFRIKTVLSADFDSTLYPDYTRIFADSGLVYLASVNEKSGITVTIDKLKSMIKSY